MKPCYLFIGLFFISAYFGLSGCSSNTITTEHPDKTVVLGHNSTNVEFRWMFTLKEKEEIKDANVIRNVKYNGTTKETFLVRFDVDRNYSQLNSSLYTFTHNYTPGSLSGYFSFTIKDITKQEDNTDGSKFRYISDELIYLLEVTYLNDVVRKESKIQLWISSLPRIFYMTSHVFAKQGDSTTLRCNASGRPSPRATWMHKDTNTVIAHSYVTSFNITGKASGGKYCCHVTNRGGNAINCTSIIVMEYQPTNTKLKSNVKFSTANATFKVSCMAEASPPARYKIQQGNITLRDNSSDGNVTIVTPGRGTNINISCFTRNKYGQENPLTIRIPIYEPPLIVTYWDHPVTTNKTNNTFQCEATGIPPPNITWHNRADNKVVSSKNGKLEVTNNDCITTQYYCKAANDAGKATTNLTVRVICKREVKGNEVHPSTELKIIIVVIVCALVLLLSVLLFILIRKRRSKRDISKDTQQQDSRQSQLAEECPYGEPIDAVQVRTGMPASGSNTDYATVEDTGYRRVKTSNHLQEPRHGRSSSNKATKTTTEPVYAKVKKKKKKTISADIPIECLYAEIPANTSTKVTQQMTMEQNQTTPVSKPCNKEEDGVDTGEGTWCPFV